MNGSEQSADPRQRVSAFQEPPAAEPLANLTVLNRLNEIAGRIMWFAVAMMLSFVLVALPWPFVPQTTVTEIVINLLLAPLQGHLPESYGEGFTAYLYVMLTLACILSHPILVRHALDVSAPRTVPNRRRRL